MESIQNIALLDLILGFVIMVIPISLMLYFKVKLVKGVLIGLMRMVIQLSLVALYLEWIFEQNNAFINTLWVMVMMFVGVSTSIKRIGLNWRYFLIPFSIAALTSVLIIDSFFLGAVIKLDYIFDARYFIPITGMVLGNSLNHNIVGLTTYFKGLSEKQELYYFLLTNTGDKKIAIRPFIVEAVKRGLNPMIASMTVMGLISLPGMMTGQILGGSSPAIAIKYQIMIMLSIFTGCTLNLFLSIIISNSFVFDGYHRLKESIFRNKG